MDSEQIVSEPDINYGFHQDGSFMPKPNSISAPAGASEIINGCFDCNICLDSAHDPVVTLCGHLYCWPCIYKWLDVQSSSLESDEQPKCPVCKAYISKSSLVPLYGRGASSPESEARKHPMDLVVPGRPPAVGIDSLLSNATSMNSHPHPQFHSNPFQPQPESFPQQNYLQPQLQSFQNQAYLPHSLGNYAPIESPGFGNAAFTSFFSPMIGMFGEMVFPRMFGSSNTSLFAYYSPHSYYPSVNGSPRRMRRQEQQVGKSLARVYSFLFCCLVLCLLLF